jgi:D-arabinose 1-dehydrogenase-like Zn-dependent alcohol dehydrogenase
MRGRGRSSLVLKTWSLDIMICESLSQLTPPVMEVVTKGDKFQVGARVMSLLASGGYAEYVAVDERLLMGIPENLSYDQA